MVRAVGSSGPYRGPSRFASFTQNGETKGLRAARRSIQRSPHLEEVKKP